jgi:hypothetical protein
VFKSQIGGNAMSNNWVIYFKRKSWRVMEVSKSIGGELGGRVCSGSIRKSSNKTHDLLHQLERSQRNEGININIRLGSTMVIYKSAKRMMVLDRRVWVGEGRVWVGEGRVY